MEKNKEKVEKTCFTSKEKYYYRVINKFFRQTDFKNIIQMIDIIESRSKISLRLLDWFVTSYACDNMVCYNIENEEDLFIVHIGYKAQLKSYKKRYFDPFRRGKRFSYCYTRSDRTKRLETTLGQLNFFRWAFSYKIIKYVENNFDDITKEMIANNKANKKEKKNKIDTKRNAKNMKGKTKKITVKKKNIKIKAEQNIDNEKIELTLSFS